MPTLLTEVAPKALLVGLGIWGLAHWAFIGGEVAKRQMIKDGHVAMCEQGYSDTMMAEAERAIAAIPTPEPDPQREAAAKSIRRMKFSPMGQIFRLGEMQTGISVEDTLAAYEQQKHQAVTAYDQMVEAVKARTDARIANANDYCGCLVTESVSAAQNEFAIFSGTFGLVRSNKIADLDGLMARTQASGLCNHIGERG